MQAYYEEMKEMENTDLDFMIVEKKVQLDQARNSNSLVVVCCVSFFIFGITKFLFDGINILENILMYFTYLLFAIVGVFFGDYIYKRTVWKPLYEIEILNYIKERNSLKQSNH